MVAEAVARPQSSTRRERVGWYFYDWANSAFATTVVTVFLGPYLGSIAEAAADSSGRVYPLGIPVAAGSLFAYTVSLSVFLQVFVLPTVGAIADRSSRKKQLLALLSYVGAGATVGLVFLTGQRYLLGAALFLIANIAFGASVVVYNSFLPQIAGPDERDKVSSIGWAVGYVGGGLLLALNVAAVLAGDSLGVRSPGGASCRPGCGGRRSPPSRWCRCATAPPPPVRRTVRRSSTGSASSGTPCASSRGTR
jgi:UMF1 family MFS transporter